MEWKQHHPEEGDSSTTHMEVSGRQHQPNPREGERSFPLGRAAFPFPLGVPCSSLVFLFGCSIFSFRSFRRRYFPSSPFWVFPNSPLLACLPLFGCGSGERVRRARGAASPFGGAAPPPLARRCFLTLLCWAVVHRIALLGRAAFLHRSPWVVLPLLPGVMLPSGSFLAQLLPPTYFLYLSNIHLNVYIHLVCVHLYICTQSKYNIYFYLHI